MLVSERQITVLSVRTCVIVSAFSMASAFLIKIPARPPPNSTIIDIGVATPGRRGAIIKTAMAFTRA